MANKEEDEEEEEEDDINRYTGNVIYSYSAICSRNCLLNDFLISEIVNNLLEISSFRSCKIQIGIIVKYNISAHLNGCFIQIVIM